MARKAHETLGPGAGRVSPRVAAWLAWFLWVLCVALPAFAALLDYYTPQSPGTGLPNLTAFVAVPLLVYVTVGALVASRRPKNPIGWILCGIGFVFGLQSFATAYADYALLAWPGSLPGGVYMAGISQTGIVLSALALATTMLVLLFPDGRLPHRRFRAAPWMAVGGSVTLALWAATAPQQFDRYSSSNPFWVGDTLKGFFDMLGRLGGATLFVIGVVSVISVFVRLRSAEGAKRQQIKWFAYAAALLLGSFYFFPLMWWLPLWVSFLGGVAGLSVIPVAVGIAILRYRLYDIDRIINRTLVYGSLTALLVVYFGGVTATQAIFRTFTGQEQQPQLVVVASTLVIAALFTPLRRRIQVFIDRRFYRRKYDARRTLETFSARLRDETDLNTLRDDLVGVVRETMQPAHAGLWLRPDLDAKGGRGEPRG